MIQTCAYCIGQSEVIQVRKKATCKSTIVGQKRLYPLSPRPHHLRVFDDCREFSLSRSMILLLLPMYPLIRLSYHRFTHHRIMRLYPYIIFSMTRTLFRFYENASAKASLQRLTRKSPYFKDVHDPLRKGTSSCIPLRPATPWARQHLRSRGTFTLWAIACHCAHQILTPSCYKL